MVSIGSLSTLVLLVAAQAIPCMGQQLLCLWNCFGCEALSSLSGNQGECYDIGDHEGEGCPYSPSWSSEDDQCYCSLYDNILMNTVSTEFQDPCRSYLNSALAESPETHKRDWKNYYLQDILGCSDCVDSVDSLRLAAGLRGVWSWLKNNAKLVIEIVGAAGCVAGGVTNPTLATCVPYWEFCGGALNIIHDTSTGFVKMNETNEASLAAVGTLAGKTKIADASSQLESILQKGANQTAGAQIQAMYI